MVWNATVVTTIKKQTNHSMAKLRNGIRNFFFAPTVTLRATLHVCAIGVHKDHH